MEEKNKINEEPSDVIKSAAQNIGLDLTGENSAEFVLEENPIAHVSALEEELREEKNKYLLLYADFENHKRRAQKEKEELRNSTKVSMITSILDMDSDLELAIKNIKDKAAKKGVELIASKVQNFLKGQGIEPIQTDTYDEELHEVISVMEIGESKIVDVVSKGYTLNGKPFRFPKIVLGK